MQKLAIAPFVDGFAFLEGPRWHRGRLWLSDMWGLAVWALRADGAREKIIDVPQRPSGIGFLPDGTPLVVSMADRRLYRIRSGALELHADLSRLASGDVNDLLVDPQGRAYAGNFGYDILRGEAPRPTDLLLVTPDGVARVVARDLVFPNGMVLADGGRTLVVAETFAHRLSAFDVAADGALSGRREFAALGEYTPDGICLDRARGIWVAAFEQGEFLRVEEGGKITHAIDAGGRRAVACQLGGEDGRTLFCLTFDGTLHEISGGARKARVESARVETAGAGSP